MRTLRWLPVIVFIALSSNLEISAEILYVTDFSTDPATQGWTGFAASQWEWGVATASSGCSGNQDPATDHSPSSDNYIVGYDIGACYPNSIPEYSLTSPAFDCSAYAFVFVDFYRFLGVESATYDRASVRLSTNGSTWTTIWDHSGSSFSDTSWTPVNYDISTYAAGQSAVQIRFVMGATDSSVVYCGWNIDDFMVIGGTSGTLEGTVTDDSRAPIEGATITVVETGDTATTIADGSYTMTVLSGTYEVTCAAEGHNTASVSDVVVSGGATTTLDFVLTYPDIAVDPASFDVTLPVGGTQDEILTISNEGNGDLDYMISINPPQTREVGDWTDVTPIATAVQWPASCFGQGIFFVAGGFRDINTGDIFDFMQMYNTATGTWTTSAYVPTPLFSATAAYYDGKVYLCGGYVTDSFVATNKTQIYDIATDTWTQGATMPTARGGCSGGIIGSKIYTLGGSWSSSFPTDNVAYEYDIPTNSWTVKTSGPINTYGISLGGGCALNGKIYTGGHFSSSYYQFYSYDPVTDTWATLPNIPTACGGQTVSMLGLETEGFVLAVGGGYDWIATGATFKFDPETNTWTDLIKPMTEAVLGGGCVAGYGTIYFYGGTTGSGPFEPAPFMSTTFDYITWLTADPISGTIAPGSDEQVTVHFDANAAGGIGDYEAWIVVGSNDGDENPLNVPATLHVSGGPTRTPTPDPTNTPTTRPTSTPTPELTTTPTPEPTETPTHAECSDLTINPEEVTFNPGQASPGDLVEITAVIRNTGDMAVDYTEVYFAYELTPLNPDDDPNAELISSPVLLTNLDVGNSASAVVEWDTTGLPAASCPVYIMTHNTIPTACNPGRYVQTDYLVPVILNDFVASGFNGSVDLNWTTESEINNIGFDIYRSTTYFDSYEKINESLIPGAGTSFSRHDYSFTDPRVSNGTPYFYQLVMIDGNAQRTASHIVAGVPHQSDLRIQIATDTNRTAFETGQSLLMSVVVENPGESSNVEIQMLLLINGQLFDSILAPTTVMISSGMRMESMFLEHSFSEGDPEGDYLLVTLVKDVASSELTSLDLTGFSFGRCNP